MKVLSATSKPKVVVVGGSLAGLCAIRHLSKNRDLDITLVEPKGYFEYTPGVLHLLAGSNGDLSSPLEDITGDAAAIVHGQLYGINDNAESKSIIVRLVDTDGVRGALREIPYDAVIICTGAPYTAPIRQDPLLPATLESRLLEIDRYSEKLSKANRVIIAGGGLVGVELAAEISCRLAGQVEEVVLISRSTLLGSLPEAAGQYALQWLKKRKNVKVLLDNEIVGAPFTDSSDVSSSDSSSGPTLSYRTLKGEVLKGDLFIDCTGRNPTPVPPSAKEVSDMLVTSTIDMSSADGAAGKGDSKKNFVWPYAANGLIQVDEHLMALKYPKAGLFAAGDVVEHCPGVGFASTTAKSGPFGRLSARPSVRNAHLAESQAELCASNVARYLSPPALSSSALSSPQLSTQGMLKYPQGSFGVRECPLLACVSLGPMHGIVIFNNLVLGGILFSMIGGFVKYVIERSKMAEIRNESWGRAFWALGHVVVNACHVLHVRVRGILRLPLRLFGGRGEGAADKDAKLKPSFG